MKDSDLDCSMRDDRLAHFMYNIFMRERFRMFCLVNLMTYQPFLGYLMPDLSFISIYIDYNSFSQLRKLFSNVLWRMLVSGIFSLIPFKIDVQIHLIQG